MCKITATFPKIEYIDLAIYVILKPDEWGSVRVHAKMRFLAMVNVIMGF